MLSMVKIQDPTVARLELITYWEFTWNWWLFSTSSIDRGISTVEITERRIEPSESASDPVDLRGQRIAAGIGFTGRHFMVGAVITARCL